jgi:hypothetical protein
VTFAILPALMLALIGNAPPAFVPFGDVVRDPAASNGKSILTSSIVLSGREWTEFYDAACQPDPQHDVATSLVASTEKAAGSSGWKRLSRVLRESAALVIVTAIFHGPLTYQGPPITDTNLRTVLGAGGRYGHMGFARFRLRILTVEYAAAISVTAPPH